MVPLDKQIGIERAGADGSDVVFVAGLAPAGLAATLIPRRYRKQPEWWAIEVVGVESPGSDDLRFQLSCAATSIWGTKGIEFVSGLSTLRVPRRRASWSDRLRLGRSKSTLRYQPKDPESF